MDNKEYQEKLLKLTAQMSSEEQANLLSYALQLSEQHSQEQR